MISKDGKLFGKISIIDIAVILIFILLAVGVLIKFSGNPNVELVSGEPIECTLKVTNVRDYTVEALKKGGAVYDTTTKEYIGEITDAWSEGAQATISMADGTIKTADAEDRYNVYVKVAFTGKIADNGYYTASNRQIAVGSAVPISSKYAQSTSQVVEVGKAQK